MDKDILWKEFQDLRRKIRDLRDNVTWAARKRDESLTIEEYALYAREFNRFMEEQSDTWSKENAMHFQILNAMQLT